MFTTLSYILIHITFYEEVFALQNHQFRQFWTLENSSSPFAFQTFTVALLLTHYLSNYSNVIIIKFLNSFKFVFEGQVANPLLKV